MPLTPEEKALRKQLREEKEAERKAQEEASRKLEMEDFYRCLPNLVLRLLCELDQERIEYTLIQPKGEGFEIKVSFTGYREGFSLPFSFTSELPSYNDYLSVKYDFEEAFQNLECIRRARQEAEELSRKRQAALSKLTTEERKLLGL